MHCSNAIMPSTPQKGNHERSIVPKYVLPNYSHLSPILVLYLCWLFYPSRAFCNKYQRNVKNLLVSSNYVLLNYKHLSPILLLYVICLFHPSRAFCNEYQHNVRHLFVSLTFSILLCVFLQSQMSSHLAGVIAPSFI